MKRGRKLTTDTKPEILAHLGTAPDADVGARFGVSAATVCNLRKKNKIPHYGSLAQKSGNFKAPADTTGLVVLVSRFDGTTAQVLNSHKGIRVYHRDRLDPRLYTEAGPPPFFETWMDAEAHLMVEPGKHRPCLIPLSVAKKVFTEVFAVPEELVLEPIAAKLAEAAKTGRGVHLTASEVASLNAV